MSGFFQKFTLYELVVMAVMAALDIATKQIVAPIAHIVCGPFAIPSGALAGGFYMMWIVIGYGIVRKPGAALIISTIQALLVFFTGVVGSHGIMSLFTYICPGMAVELVLIITRHRCCCAGCCALAGIAANMTGTACVNIVFFRAPGVYLILVRNEETLGYFTKGGTGPMRAVFCDDTYGNRSIKYLTKIDCRTGK